MEIDEKTRFRADYFRVKIACRDLQKVPSTAEGTLGLCIHDFGFEREDPEESSMKTLSSGIIVGSKEPPSKKHKADDQVKSSVQVGTSSQSMPMITEAGSSKQSQHQKAIPSCISSPPKMLGGKAIDKAVNIEQDIYKSISIGQGT